jgi:exonuclease III
MFRLLAYNIDCAEGSRLERISTVLHAAGADVVTLVEVTTPTVAATLAGRLGMTYVWERGSGDRHVATLSRPAIVESRIYRSPPITQAVLETRHELPSGSLTVFNVHLLPYLLLPFELRRWQAIGRLLQIIRDRRVMPHLIVGDLNAVAPGDHVLHRKNPVRMQRLMAMQLFVVFRPAIRRLLRAGYLDCYRALHPDRPGFTFMPGGLTTRYDYVMADAIMAPRLRSCRVVDDVAGVDSASDHYPVLAEFDVSGALAPTRGDD